MRLGPPDGAPLHGPVAVVGIGNEQNGDDGVGVIVARRLRDGVGARRGVLVLDAGTSPENLTGTIRRFAPRTVVLVDAADFGEPPGSAVWVPCEDADGLSASTHTLPPTLLSRFLTTELGCRVILLAIQPLTLEPGEPLSAIVRANVDGIVAALTSHLP